MTKRVFALFWAVAAFFCTVATAGGEPYSVAKWKGNAKCAVSYTFDDGLKDQYTLLFPVLKECGIRATFWLVGNKIGDPSGFRSKVERHTPVMTWDDVKEMADAGQEMSSHGLNHISCAKLANDEIVREVVGNKKLIKEKTGIEPVTFAYPFNARTNKLKEPVTGLVEAQGLVGSRCRQKAFGGGLEPEKARNLVENAKKKGDWLVFMTHGIERGYDSFDDPEAFFDHLRWVAKERDVWVAPWKDVCIYEKLREAVLLDFGFSEDGMVKVTPSVNGLDKELYAAKLTLIDEKGVPVHDFDPFAGPFTLRP